MCGPELADTFKVVGPDTPQLARSDMKSAIVVKFVALAAEAGLRVYVPFN
jgi:hypothetical protein